MKNMTLAIAVLLCAAACRTAPDGPGADGGYAGIERIDILAKGME